MDSPSRHVLDPIAGVGMAPVMIGCCAAQGLNAGGIASGALGALGAWLSNPGASPLLQA